jgi:RNA polymerase sigma factor (sigma-70 family)
MKAKPADSEIPDPPQEPGDLETWSAFQQEVECLSVMEREVLRLHFYHGWKHSRIARLFDVDERTVRRHHEAALHRLHRRLAE